MSEQEDAFHEWVHSTHTAQLLAKAEKLVNQRQELLLKTCAVSTDLRVTKDFGEYSRALALKNLLEKGDF